MFLSSSFSLPSYLRVRPPSPPDLPLHSPHSLLQHYINPNPDLNPDLDLVVDAPKALVPLDLFLTLLRGGLNFNPDLLLVFQEDPPIPLLLLASPLPLSPSLSLLLRLRQLHPPPPIRSVDLFADILRRFCPYLAGGPPPLVFC